MLDRPAAAVRDTLAALVADIARKNALGRAVLADEDLVGAGLTSIDMVHLMLSVEATFDITIPPAEITPENFRSISAIESVIARLTAV